MDAKHEFDQATKLIKTEVARFEQERIEDFKDSLHAFLEGMIGRQKEVCLVPKYRFNRLCSCLDAAYCGLGELPANAVETGRGRTGSARAATCPCFIDGCSFLHDTWPFDSEHDPFSQNIFSCPRCIHMSTGMDSFRASSVQPKQFLRLRQCASKYLHISTI